MRATAIAVLGAALLAVSAPMRAAGKWVEVQAPHATVVSDDGVEKARAVALEFERVRAVVKALCAWCPLPDARSHTVVAARNNGSRRRFEPRYPPKFFLATPTRDWSVYEAGRPVPNPMYLYAFRMSGVLEREFGDRMPYWLREGLLDVMATMRTDGDTVEVGHAHAGHLQALVLAAATDEMRQTGKKSVAVAVPPVEAMLVPSQLVVVRRHAPADWRTEGLGAPRAQMWAFVHFLLFGEGGAHRAKVDRMGAALAAGRSAQEATLEGLGDPAALDLPFRDYVRRAVFHFQRVQLAVAGDAASRWPARALSADEVAALIAEYRGDAAAECVRVGASCPDLD